VLLATRGGHPVAPAMLSQVAARAAGGEALWTTLAAQGLEPDISSLVPLSRWVTPTAEAKRYDTQFFAACVPTNQRDHAGADGNEVSSGLWITPTNALQATKRGEMVLAPPTVATLEDIAGCSRFSALRALSWPTAPIEPVFVKHDDRVIIALPGDALHPDPNRAFLTRTRLESVQGGCFRSA
jgi:hypothetical protein